MDALRVVTMSGIWLQDSDSLSSGNTRLLMIFVGMVAVAMVAQAIALIVMAVIAAKTRKRGLEIVEEMRSKIMPIISGASELIHDMTPKMKVITENFVETSHVIRGKAQEINVTASDLNAKTRAQAARIDGMVTSVLNATAEISESIQKGIKVPVREFSGLMNGLKAGMDVLVGRAKTFGAGQANFSRDRDPNTY